MLICLWKAVWFHNGRQTESYIVTGADINEAIRLLQAKDGILSPFPGSMPDIVEISLVTHEVTVDVKRVLEKNTP